MTKAPFTIAALAAAALFAACQPRPVLDETRSFPEGYWTYADTLDFAVTIPDTTGLYDLFLDLRHSPDFPNQNLYIRIYTRFPDGKRLDKLVSLELADKAGAWFGRCNSSECRLTIPIQSRAFFDQPGPYLFTLEQYSRIDTLPGIRSLGMRIQPAPKQDKQ
jgi:gliding motility-associated lipoprotein GldH